VNFGLLTAEIRWRVWGTPANFNGFRVLAALLHGTSSGRQPNCGVEQRAPVRATYIRQGGHHVGHWPTFLVFTVTLLRLFKIAADCRRFSSHHPTHLSGGCELAQNNFVAAELRCPVMRDEGAIDNVGLHTLCIARSCRAILGLAHYRKRVINL